HGATITSDAGLLVCRELDGSLGLTETATACLQESRGGRNVQHQLVPLLRQSVYSRLAGYEDTNDAERLAQDPAMRVIVGRRAPERQAASTNTMSRFETEVLTREENPEGLVRLNAQWVERAMARTCHRRVILDMDSSESPVHGEQEGANYNGHFESVCYHPLFLFNEFGDCEGAMLRPGNVHSADRWREVLESVVERYQEKGIRLLFRADAAFAKPEVYKYLESRHIGYAMRLSANDVLQRHIRRLLKRPVGRPPKKPVVWYHDFTYQARSWDQPRRVVAKVEWHRGELFPRVGFIVTNLSLPVEGVVHFYNGRGTAEQWIKEGKYALHWTRLSCHRFVANQVRLQLFILAYNLGNFMRRLTLPESVKHWSLRSVQTRLIKTGGRLVRHARRLVFQLAEVAVSQEVFRQVLERIGRLHPAPG
ncbi:MAG: IS1380 family transposase, partial [Dehalococcoidia bacterium]|nr:IS1380 family transposase [Dehalococcoidia bacterium]